MSSSTSGISSGGPLPALGGERSGQSRSPLENIYEDIERALDHRLYYLALVVTASLPDVCAALEGHVPTDWRTYRAWFRANVGDSLTPFGEHECYELRCGVVHQARLMGAAKEKWSEYDGLFFTLPTNERMIVSGNKYVIAGEKPKKVLDMDLRRFCRTMILSARRWEAEFRDDPDFRKRLENVVRVRPNGLAPYVRGLPVLA